MTKAVPLVRMVALLKACQALRPLRVVDLSVNRHDRLVLSGLDQMAAEMFVHLVTGAALPDEGRVSVDGRDTRDIAIDTEWLASLDRFGIVTHRAVLLDGLSMAANLALPLTLSIDPISDEVRARMSRDAVDAGLSLDRLDEPARALSEDERLRLHLARAAAAGPELVMLEHPTRRLDQAERSASFGATLKSLSTSRGFGWIAISEDESFAKASGGTCLRLDPATGRIAASGGWLRRLRARGR